MQIPLGVSIAATIRVGNELGAGRPRTAKRAAYVTVGIGGACALTFTLYSLCLLAISYDVSHNTVLILMEHMSQF